VPDAGAGGWAGAAQRPRREREEGSRAGGFEGVFASARVLMPRARVCAGASGRTGFLTFTVRPRLRTPMRTRAKPMHVLGRTHTRTCLHA